MIGINHWTAWILEKNKWALIAIHLCTLLWTLLTVKSLILGMGVRISGWCWFSFGAALLMLPSSGLLSSDCSSVISFFSTGCNHQGTHSGITFPASSVFLARLWNSRRSSSVRCSQTSSALFKSTPASLLSSGSSSSESLINQISKEDFKQWMVMILPS